MSIAVEKDAVDNPNMPKTPENFAIAFDLGVKEFLVDSNGKHIENPKILAKYEKRIKKLQKELSRKKEGSKNFEKTRIKLAKLYEKVANIRKDYLHKLSSQIVHENQVIICEDLKTKNLVRNHNFAKNILDVSWSKFVEMLEYKSNWYGRTFVKVSSSFPSSQICSNCGYKNRQVKDLKIRVWQCPICGMVHDRDENAAKNLLKEGLSHLGISINVQSRGGGLRAGNGNACRDWTSTTGMGNLHLPVASPVDEAGSPRIQSWVTSRGEKCSIS